MSERSDNSRLVRSVVLTVDPDACPAHGLCAGELPEGIATDE